MLACHSQSPMSKHVFFFWADRKGMSNTSWSPNCWLHMLDWCYVNRNYFPHSPDQKPLRSHLPDVYSQSPLSLSVTPPQFSSHCLRWTIDTGPPAALPGDLITAPPIGPSLTQTKVGPGENASTGSHSHPDNISVPLAPHALTWSSHTDRVANGHFYESKQARVGHWTSPQRTPCSPINWSLLDLGWWFRGTL